MKVNCRERREIVSNSAKACPHCGAKKPGDGKFIYGLSQLGSRLIVVGAIPRLCCSCSPAWERTRRVGDIVGMSTFPKIEQQFRDHFWYAPEIPFPADPDAWAEVLRECLDAGSAQP